MGEVSCFDGGPRMRRLLALVSTLALTTGLVLVPSTGQAQAKPGIRIISPADGATVGPKFTLQVDKSNFNPSLGLEGKPNLSGFGHYHVMVDMDVFPMMMMGGMMAMDGMVVMAGADTIPLDLSAWPPGK